MEVWEFDVDMVVSAAKRTFKGHTSMLWKEFEDHVLRILGDDTPKPIQLTYKITGDTRKMSFLNNEVDWNIAISCVHAKVKAAHKHPVSLEVKNVVSFYSLAIL
jgi:hypothetical protein